MPRFRFLGCALPAAAAVAAAVVALVLRAGTAWAIGAQAAEPFWAGHRRRCRWLPGSPVECPGAGVGQAPRKEQRGVYAVPKCTPKQAVLVWRHALLQPAIGDRDQGDSINRLRGGSFEQPLSRCCTAQFQVRGAHLFKCLL